MERREEGVGSSHSESKVAIFIRFGSEYRFQVRVGVRKNEGQSVGYVCICSCKGGWQLLAHSTVIASSTSFFPFHLGHLNLDECFDHHDRLTIVVPHISHVTMMHCLEVIYLGTTTIESDDVRGEAVAALKEFFLLDGDRIQLDGEGPWRSDILDNSNDFLDEDDGDIDTFVKSKRVKKEDIAFEFIEPLQNDDMSQDVNDNDDDSEFVPGEKSNSNKRRLLNKCTQTRFKRKRKGQVNAEERVEKAPEPVKVPEEFPDIPPNMNSLSASLLRVNATFESYQDFLTVFESYCNENYIYYTVFKSSKMDPTYPNLGRFPKRYEIMHCTHFGDKKPSKSQGFRRPKRQTASGCNFHVHISFFKRNEHYRIMSVDLSHKGHGLGVKYYSNKNMGAKVPKRRQVAMDDLNEFEEKTVQEVSKNVGIYDPKLPVSPSLIEWREKVKVNLPPEAKPLHRQTEPILSGHHSRLVPGEVFKTLAEFTDVFHKYCTENFVHYKTLRSYKNHESDDTSKHFRRIEFSCVHYGSPKLVPSSSTMRHTLATGCKFRCVVRITKSEQYVITAFDPTHYGHEVSENYFQMGKNGKFKKIEVTLFDPVELEREDDSDE